MESMGKKKPRPRRSFTPEFKAEIAEPAGADPPRPGFACAYATAGHSANFIPRARWHMNFCKTPPRDLRRVLSTGNATSDTTDLGPCLPSRLPPKSHE